jgi:hydroxyethylthiazole kinase-like uncharacterized protein yjeF
MSNVTDNLPQDLPNVLYRAEQVGELDRIAIEQQGIPGAELMERAGQAAFAALQHTWPRARSVGVLCGVGNNGGDGYVVARLAHEAGYEVSVWQLGDGDKVQGDALTARQRLSATGLHVAPFEGAEITRCEVLVDGLLGTGLSGEVSGSWRDAIVTLNTAHAIGSHVLALDIPSGLHADSGRVLGIAVEADVCVTFIGLKLGLFTGWGPALCGEVVFADLAVPAVVYQQMQPAAMRLTWSDCVMPSRPATAHKGDFGHVLVIGGEIGMAGALRLAAEAALRVGAGLVTAATRDYHAAGVSASRPEIMSQPVETTAALSPLLRRATVLALGPGLGQGEWGRAMLTLALQSPLPMVVDADALNLLADDPLQRDNWILTPHPGEAARLLGQSTDTVQADRVVAAQAIQARYGGVVVLKGAGTVVVDAEGKVAICHGGNPGMASGGMGDVLTGVIAGLLAQGLAQGLSLAEATRRGVCLHARAADVAGEAGQRGLLASDLFPVLRQLVG